MSWTWPTSTDTATNTKSSKTKKKSSKKNNNSDAQSTSWEWNVSNATDDNESEDGYTEDVTQQNVWETSVFGNSKPKKAEKKKTKEKKKEKQKEESSWAWNVGDDRNDTENEIESDQSSNNNPKSEETDTNSGWAWSVNVDDGGSKKEEVVDKPLSKKEKKKLKKQKKKKKKKEAKKTKESSQSTLKTEQQDEPEDSGDSGGWTWNLGNGSGSNGAGSKLSMDPIAESASNVDSDDNDDDKETDSFQWTTTTPKKKEQGKKQEDSRWAWNVGNESIANGHSNKAFMNGTKSPTKVMRNGTVTPIDKYTDDDSDDDEKEVKPLRTMRTTSGTLGLGILKTVSNALRKIISDGPNPNCDEMKIDVNADRIMSFFKEEDVLKFIARMMETEEIYIWQFKGNNSDSEWTTLDMTLSLYLHFLPIDESAVISMSSSGLQFTITRSSESRAVLRYSLLNNGGNDIEYALRRVSSKVEDGVYIPSLWERDLVNQSLSKGYLYSIDLKVLALFGTEKYAVWWEYLKDWVRTDQIVKVSSMQSWMTWHSFHLYFNWKRATERAAKLTRMWYVDGGEVDVMRNGFATGSKGNKFHLNFETAMVSAKNNKTFIGEQDGIGRLLLCNVCISKENAQGMMKGKKTIKVTASALCAYPELCVRVKL